MQTHDLVQGSPEWLAYRKDHFNASDAPAMMGVSPYKTRDQLLHEMHTGLAPEVDQATQARFDDGHRFEALARPLAEKIIGEELYPVTGSDGLLSASFDGLTMIEDTAFEHKTVNDALRMAFAEIGDDDTAGHLLPVEYRVQMEQQCMVSACDRVLFMATRWDADDKLLECMHVWYSPDAGLSAQIRAGWDQFAKDLAAYVPPAAVEAKPIGRTPENLPALRIEVTGQVTASNLAEYKTHALEVFKGINRNLQSDQDFADAEKVVKWCGDVETRLAAAKEHALSQTASIDTLFKAIDDISAEAKRTRLELDKLVKGRKEQIREEIVMEGRRALTAHVEGLNARLGKQYMPSISADFAGAIKGKRTIDSLRDAVNTTLANAKIESSAMADRIQINLNTLRERATNHAFLFSDTPQIVLRNPEDVQNLITARLSEHEAAEAARLEAQREQIRREEEAKAQRAAREAHDKARAAVAAIRFPTPEPEVAAELPKPAAPSLVAANNAAKAEIAQSASVVTGPLITTQALGDCLGIPVQASLIESLGFKSIKQSKPGVYWRECDVHAIGWALIERIKANLSQAKAA